MTELEFIKRIALREYPFKIAVLVVNEIVGSLVILVGIGGVTAMLGALLQGNRELPGVLGDVFARFGLDQAEPFTLLLFLVALYAVQLTLESLSKYISASISVELTRDIRYKMNNALMRADWATFSKIDQGKYMQTLVNESTLAGGAVYHMGSMLASGLVTAILLLWMVLYAFEAFVIFGVAGALLLLSVQVLLRRTRRVSQESIEVAKEMNNVVTDTRQLFKMLLVENLVKVRVQVIDRLINKATSVERRRQVYRIINDQVMALETVAVLLLVSAYYLLFEQGNNTDLIVNLLVLQRIGTYFAVFQNRRHLMVQQIPSYEASLQMTEVFAEPLSKQSGEAPIARLDQGIELHDVSYHYADGQGGVQDISLRLPAHGLVFFVGKSGSGKTTLVDIITGLIPPQKGSVLFDGRPLDRIEPTSLAELFSYVPQQAHLFAGSLRENLAFGSRTADDAALRRGLEAADCLQVVEAQDHGLDSQVQAGGVNFSGGERHRLALARALIRGGKILVLDEPAASVDPESEQAIFRALESLSKEMLIIVVTHSRDVIREQENIYLLDAGHCVFKGSYSQFEKHEEYKQLLLNQDSILSSGEDRP